MTPDLLDKLIIRIWRSGLDNRIQVGQIRATKLIYLVEWDHYAWSRHRLTNLNWVFLHYGPWSSQLSDRLSRYNAPDEESEPGKFRQVYWTPPEYEEIDTRLEVGLEGTLQRVLETFGAMPTPEIIRYVYFNTEPMRQAVRGQPLDFTPTIKPTRPLNPVTTLPRRDRESLRDRFRAATASQLARKEPDEGALPAEVFQVLSILDSAGPIALPESDIQISEEDRLRLAGEW